LYLYRGPDPTTDQPTRSYLQGEDAGGDDLALASGLIEIAIGLRNRKADDDDYEKAEVINRRAYMLLTRAGLDDTDKRTARCLASLGCTRLARGDAVEAEALLTRAVEVS